MCDKNIKVINLKTGHIYEDKPLVAIGNNAKHEDVILAVGKQASAYSNAINPFSHPRVIIDDFKMAELVLRYAFEMATQRKVIFSPIVIIRVLKKFDTALTVIEKMILCELSSSAGARETIIYDGADLDLNSVDYESLRESSYCCEERVKTMTPTQGCGVVD